MKNKSVLCALVLVVLMSFGIIHASGFVKTYDDSSGRFESIIQTWDGGFAVFGRLSGSNLWWMKLDADGEISFQVTNNFGIPHQVIITSDGGFAVATRSYGLMKLDANLNRQSFRVYDKEADARSIAETFDGSGNPTGYILAGESSLSSAGRDDFFLIKLNAEHHFAEANPHFRKALVKNLYQRNLNKDFPFMSLNPQFAWHSDYWTRRFQKILEKLIEKKNITYREALSVIANKVACLQYVPYHSKSGLPRGLPTLASTEKVRQHVHKVILPRVKKDKALVIVMRKSKEWGLPSHRNIIKYKGPEARGGLLTDKARRKIEKWLGL